MRAFQDYDVVVAGAGTAGACAAWHFAKAGKRVLLFDAGPIDDAGARWINGIPPWMFDEAGVPRPEGDELNGRDFAAQLLDADGRRKLRLARAPIWNVDMRRLGARLRSMASAAGAELRERTRAESFEFDGGRPRILTVRGESGEEQIRADLFVDATGRRGALRSLSPALRTWCSDALPSDLCTAAQEVRRIEDTRHAADFLGRYDAKDGDALSFLGIAGGFSTLTIHVHVDRAEIAILTGAIADGRHPDGPQMMKKFLERESWIGEKIFGGSGLIPLRRPFARQAVPGLALIGNAGSQVFPAHGSGIGSGLIAARLLAESAAAYDDVGGLEPLWAYQQRFQRTIGAVNAAYDQFRLFSQTLSGGEVGDLLGAGLMRASSSLAALDQKIPAIGIGEGAALTFAAARAPRLAARFIRPVRAMRRAYAHYLAYPQTPDDDALRTWAARESELFS